jgi:hypothetical protein
MEGFQYTPDARNVNAELVFTNEGLVSVVCTKASAARAVVYVASIPRFYVTPS